LATTWFGDEERALATTIGSLATPIGCILGMILGPFFVYEDDKEHHELGITHVENYMFISAAIVTALTVPMIIFFKEQPELFPSYTAKNTTNTKFDFKDDIKELARNQNYKWINLSFMLMYGCYTCLGAIINDLVSKFGFSSTDSSIMGACFIMSGLVGSFIFSA
jgi:MFS family permease